MTSARRIDFHFHLIPKFYQDAVYAAGTGPRSGVIRTGRRNGRLELMDAHGIEVALTSLAQPGVQFGDPASALALARRCNEYAAELNARWPRRFGALCGGADVGDRRRSRARSTTRSTRSSSRASACSPATARNFSAIRTSIRSWRRSTAAQAVVFVHPALHPSSRKLDLPWPGFMMEYLFDTTRAAVNLVFGGAIERFPRIRFVLAHAGGLMPYFAWRLSVSPMIDARLPQILARADVYARLRHFWYDIALSPDAADAWRALPASRGRSGSCSAATGRSRTPE